jgi:starch-binding outer membrane protein, SusD/RagB family
MQSRYDYNKFKQFKLCVYQLPLKLVPLILVLILSTSGCKKLIEVDPPITSLNASNIYINDATANAAIIGIYARMSNNTFASINIGVPSLTFLLGLSSDELMLFSGVTNNSVIQYFRNDLDATTVNALNFWSNIYPIVFDCNNAIEGLAASSSLTPSVKQQLVGESKFSRAFCYFYLVNLYGGVPLVTGTNWQVNSSLPNMDKAQIWEQIISDLKDAQELLNEGYIKADGMTVYSIGSAERIRPNKYAATALLARAYLYSGDYVSAEREASKVLNNSAFYNLTALKSVFLKNSFETIWQWPRTIATGNNSPEGQLLILPTSGPSTSFPVYLNNSLLSSFESGDLRKVNWVSSVTPTPPGTSTYYFPYKYKINDPLANANEYTMVLRLAEQYLIRAEARVQQNDINGAKSDLNVIRTRAGLSNTIASDKTSLLVAIAHERQVELFTELGHRWLDIKRTNSVDIVMNSIVNQKGGSWQTTDQLYPIPLSELQKAPQLVQNPGY